jgi:catechol 2,3-dioxygenase-like lactoylglutathione lyase family enzyme
MTTPAARVESLDHLVITVRDFETSCRFYEQVLGMVRHEVQPGRWSLNFGQQKLNVHIAGKVIDPHVRHATPGSADLCFLTSTPIADVAKQLAIVNIAIVDGPIHRFGAVGPIHSIYFYDPDENLIEVANRLY